MRPCLLLAALAGVVPCAASPADETPPVQKPVAQPAFLFAYFTGNGEDGLHLAASTDGLAWTALNGGKSYLKPLIGGKLMRDPCVTRGPDGTYHLVWTTGWEDKGVGIAHSSDLIHWSEQTWLPVMEHESGAQNAWAPEILHDPAAKRFLIYWSTTLAGKFPETARPDGDTFSRTKVPCNHRIYFTATADFKTYTPAALLYDPGFNCIDATIAPAEGRWIMFLKDETKVPVAKKNIRIAWADHPEGPWSAAGEPITDDWVEGPTALKIGDDWHLYVDAYTRHRFEGLRSTDLKTWKPIDSDLSFPKGVRHGTAFAAPPDLLQNLQAGPPAPAP